MSSKQTITHQAAAKSMTLAEVSAFVQDAMRRDVDPGAKVEVRATIGGGIKSLAVTDDGGPEQV